MLERNEAIKIAFVGTSSVGKTTLLEFYKTTYNRNQTVAFVPEAARKYFTVHSTMPLAERFTEQAQSEVQDLALSSERTARDSGAKLIFCDRSVMDAPAYVKSTGDVKGATRLLKRINHWIPTYTALFLLDPQGITMSHDEIRKEDQDTRLRFHDAFLELFESEGIKYELLGGSTQERIQVVDRKIAQSGITFDG